MKKRTVKQIIKQYKKDGVTEDDIFNCHDCNRHYVRQEVNYETSCVVEEEACAGCGGVFCEDCFDHTEHEGCIYLCNKCSVKHKNGEDVFADDDEAENMEAERLGAGGG